jgi:hypothetical protein
MILEPATSFAQGATRVAILTVLVVGFVSTIGCGFWLAGKWSGGLGSRASALPLAVLFPLYLLLALVLVQFW